MQILVTDAGGSVRNEVVRLLEKQGFRVDTAESCVATVRRLARQTYDCLILDDALPDGTGLDIFRVLLSPAPHVLLFTAGALTPMARKETMRMGVEKIFAKPDQAEDLVAYVIDCCQDVKREAD